MVGISQADKMKSTVVTWIEMDDNTNPMAQPIVPYHLPNATNYTAV
jgi:hypothetical protein